MLSRTGDAKVFTKSVKHLALICGLARPSGEVWAGLCIGALDGLAFFASFWGNAKKKEQLKQEQQPTKC